MGYDIYWNSNIRITPPLSDEHMTQLKYIVLDEDPRTQDVFAQVLFPPDVEDMHHRFHGPITKDTLTWELSVDKETLPDLMVNTRWCVDDALAAFKFLIENFFKPRGYTVGGDLNWSGEESDDRGVLYIEGDSVEAVADVIENPGPSWNRETSTLTATQRAVIRQVLRFALARPGEFTVWLGSTHAGEEVDLMALSTEAVSEMAYNLLNDDLSEIPHRSS